MGVVIGAVAATGVVARTGALAACSLGGLGLGTLGLGGALASMGFFLDENTAIGIGGRRARAFAMCRSRSATPACRTAEAMTVALLNRLLGLHVDREFHHARELGDVEDVHDAAVRDVAV